MLKCNIQDMSDLELSELSQAIIAEREKRKNVKAECLWRDVMDAVRAYCRECGDIDIYSDESYQGCLDTHTQWDDIGRLNI